MCASMTITAPTRGCCPASIRRDYRTSQWAPACPANPSSSFARKARSSAQGIAGWLRHHGIAAEILEGGFEAWKRPNELLVRSGKLPPRDEQGRTVWVTRTRPKVDRIACPWLIRRFVDPAAVFLFVEAAEVSAVADRFKAMPFDIEDVFWSHRGERCTFDTMIEEFGLDSGALDRLATIVRAPTRRGSTWFRNQRVPRGVAGLSRMYPRRFATARGRHGCSMTRSSDGVATPPRKPTIGQAPSRRPSCRTARQGDILEVTMRPKNARRRLGRNRFPVIRILWYSLKAQARYGAIEQATGLKGTHRRRMSSKSPSRGPT